MRPGSGGHNHTNSPPLHTLGTFENTRTGETEHGVLTTHTEDDGRIEIEYTAMPFGGMLDLTVESQTRDVKAEDSLTVKVPALEELKPGPHFELVGAPDNYSGTNDPCREPPTSQHYSNHWGVPDLNSAVRQIATDYESLHPDTKLRVNDMSLKWGGLFDFNNNWSPPHKSHRTGTNADIGFKAIGPDGGCKRDTNLKILRRVIIKYTGKIPLKETGHYHIYSNRN